MIGEQQRRVDVESRVRKELERIGLYRIPVNPIQLANRLGISVKGVEFVDDSVISAVETRDGSAKIFVADAETPYRKRFAIAHELGHYFLHLMENRVIKDGEIVDPVHFMSWGKEQEARLASEFRRRRSRRGLPGLQREEIEANWFATELLMPEESVRDEWEWHPSARRLARVFNVTAEAIQYRLDDLGL